MSGECPKCSEHPVDCLCAYGYKPEWGFHNLMVVACFRYCLGRRSYIVSNCVEFLTDYWGEFDKTSKETKEALEKGHAGDKCDEDRWKQLLAHVSSTK